MDNRGERVDNRMDNRSDRVDNRMDNRGDRLDNRGERLENRGDRIENRGDWLSNSQDYWQGVHDDWYHGGWNGNWGYGDGWYDHPWAAWGLGAAAWGLTSWGAGSLFYDTGYYGYENPYYVAAPTTTVVEYPVYDYSQPIVTTMALPDVSSPAVVTAVSESDQAREAFYQGDYNRALTAIDAALAKTPSDIVLHEFRALALFALQRYKEAASTLYAVLSVGPGWDWTTMSGLYQDIDTYTRQLRELESFVKNNPSSPDGHFLLAYQYMTDGHLEAAAGQFKKVAALLPQDQVSQQLAELLVPPTQQPASQAAESPSESPAEPQPTAQNTPQSTLQPTPLPSLVGKWSAPATGGGNVELVLGDGGQFTWTHTRNGKAKAFEGNYGLTGNTLVMEYTNGGSMVGKVRAEGDNRFAFKMVGGPPKDPGLVFSK
jgi:tetratricopeptide (TPR) repeat protein